MATGIFRGFVTGVVVATAGVGVFSLVQSPPKFPAPETGAVEVPAGSDFESAREDTEPKLPAGQDTAPQPEDTPKIGGDVTSESPVDEAATKPAARPETGTPEGTLTAPASDGTDAQTASPATPVATTEVVQPSTPAGDKDDGKISTDPAQPAPPEETEQSAFPAGSDRQEEIDASPGAEENSPPAASQRTAPLPTVSDTPAADDAGNGPRIGKPAGTFIDRAPEPSETVAVPQSVQDQRRPIEANAATFDNPEGKPLMSVVLLDDEAGAIGPEALSTFPYALSIAVDPMSPDAQDRMQLYRAAGFDVMALIDMPAGATASDTETLLRAALERLPSAVAVLEGVETGLQSDKAVSDQAAAILAETGHGLVMFPKGLNTAQKLAAQAGVPSATLFRDFDAKGQSAAVIRRFLDQAAFKARQEENGVIMLGRMRPDTISALLLWGLQDRASSVALAPISALLLATEN